MSRFVNDVYEPYRYCYFKQGSDYRCIISLISTNEAINLLQNSDLIEKSKA